MVDYASLLSPGKRQTGSKSDLFAQILGQALEAKPIQSPLEGLAGLGEAFLLKRGLDKAQSDDTANANARQKELATALGYGADQPAYSSTVQGAAGPETVNWDERKADPMAMARALGGIPGMEGTAFNVLATEQGNRRDDALRTQDRQFQVADTEAQRAFQREQFDAQQAAQDRRFSQQLAVGDQQYQRSRADELADDEAALQRQQQLLGQRLEAQSQPRPMSATAQRMLVENTEALSSAEHALRNLQTAETLAQSAPSGMVATLTNLTSPVTGGNAELAQLDAIMKQLGQQYLNAFKGATTDRELQFAQEIGGMSTMGEKDRLARLQQARADIEARTNMLRRQRMEIEGQSTPTGQPDIDPAALLEELRARGLVQ